ncbi:MAG TPA: ElyC/SanA/YdcF family protein [Acidobacteriota bacterium]|nr:ElyC/SanA/YdcF family protein [Acidobacteriota bacterium]
MIPAEPAPPPADLLFVFAGAPWRKRAALDAWRGGAARALVLSVGRFEWRRLPELGIADDGGLAALVEATPPERRHFLLVLEEGRAAARLVPKGRLGTWSEALALASLARERGAGSIEVCTSGYHMPRALLSVRRAIGRTVRGGAGPLLRPLPVAEPDGSTLASDRVARSPRAWRALGVELVKRIGYLLAAR